MWGYFKSVKNVTFTDTKKQLRKHMMRKTNCEIEVPDNK